MYFAIFFLGIKAPIGTKSDTSANTFLILKLGVILSYTIDYSMDSPTHNMNLMSDNRF